MVKITEVDENNINNLSQEEMKEIILTGKTELLSSRNAIATIDSKLKNLKNNPDNTTPDNTSLSEERLNELLEKREREKSINSFFEKNPDLKEKENEIKDLVEKGISLELATSEVMKNDESYVNQMNTNNTGIGVGLSANNGVGTSLLSKEEYRSLDAKDRDAYADKTFDKYGVVKYSD